MFAMPVPFHVLHQAVLESMVTVILDSTPPGYIASHQSGPFSVKILEMAVRLRKRCRVLHSCDFQHPWHFCSLHMFTYTSSIYCSKILSRYSSSMELTHLIVDGPDCW